MQLTYGICTTEWSTNIAWFNKTRDQNKTLYIVDRIVFPKHEVFYLNTILIYIKPYYRMTEPYSIIKNYSLMDVSC